MKPQSPIRHTRSYLRWALLLLALATLAADLAGAHVPLLLSVPIAALALVLLTWRGQLLGVPELVDSLNEPVIVAEPAVAELASTLTARLDAGGEITAASTQLATWLGCTTQALQGQSLTATFGPANASLIKSRLDAAWAGAMQSFSCVVAHGELGERCRSRSCLRATRRVRCRAASSLPWRRRRFGASSKTCAAPSGGCASSWTRSP